MHGTRTAGRGTAVVEVARASSRELGRYSNGVWRPNRLRRRSVKNSSPGAGLPVRSTSAGRDAPRDSPSVMVGGAYPTARTGHGPRTLHPDGTPDGSVLEMRPVLPTASRGRVSIQCAGVVRRSTAGSFHIVRQSCFVTCLLGEAVVSHNVAPRVVVSGWWTVRSTECGAAETAVPR